MNGRDLHSALKTDEIASYDGGGVNFKIVKLQWGKNDFGFSIHALPHTFSTAGFQTTDFLAYLGFQRSSCAFTISREGYCMWIQEDFNLENFCNAFSKSFEEIKKAQKLLQACGYSLDQPEGWGYFFGKASQGRDRAYTSYDGHTAPKAEIMKNTEDQFFQFVLSWIEGGAERGWTFHYRPKHSPLSPEFDAAIRYLKIHNFNECPCFDFEPCYWNFIPFEQRGSSHFDSNVEAVHRWYDAHEHNFSQGINSLLSAQSFIDKFDMYFLPIEQKEPIRTDTQMKRNIIRSVKPLKRQDKKYDFDVSISFAGTERTQAESLALSVRDAGFDVFYDDFYPEQLWGRDLITFFDDVYRKRSRYCVIFVSAEYCDRMWTTHERKSAQARALQEKGNEYILPIKVDNSELPGLQPTTGYLSIKDHGINKITEILIKKLNS